MSLKGVMNHMATKRTFSLEFLQHPPYLTLTDHLKALYFALMSLADDDGFLYLSDSLLRQINAKKSDISRLSSQNLLHLFDNKIAVILHWRVHNTIQKDRYTPTIYIKERQQLCLDNRKIYRILTGGLDTNNPKKTTSEEKRREENRI